jgi:hypothetical protein
MNMGTSDLHELDGELENSETCEWCDSPKENRYGICGVCYRFPNKGIVKFSGPKTLDILKGT